MKRSKFMEWICVKDQTKLEKKHDHLYCSECRHQYALFQEIPSFAITGEEEINVLGHYTHLDCLLKLMKNNDPENTARAFCDKYNCSRSPLNADWKFFFPVTNDSTVLEIGAGFGDDTTDLASKCKKILSLVSNKTNALILKKRLEKEKIANVDIAITRQVSHVPVSDESVNAISLEDAAIEGFSINNQNFPEIAAEWKRILAPGGCVFVGVQNNLYQFPGIKWLKNKLGPKKHFNAFNRTVKNEKLYPKKIALNWNHVTKCMKHTGFNTALVYTPLPDENKTKIVVPVNEKNVILYFLNYLVRKNSMLVRSALMLATTFVHLNLFKYMVPYYFLIFYKEKIS